MRYKYTLIMEEIWKDIVGFEGLYEVSSAGRIKRKSGHKKWSGNAFYLLPEAILGATLAKKSGYVVVNIQSKVYYIHRLVAYAFKGKDPHYGLDVNHKNGNKQDNSNDNLEWCTRKFNINHAFDTGLTKIKSDHHSSKYSQELVDDIIRKAKETGLKATDLKNKFYPKIPRTTINSFIYGYNRRGR